jgi:glycosyltransferase involved in cell wall biosynthesis
VHEAACALGLVSVVLHGPLSLAVALGRALAAHPEAAVLATGLVHSVVAALLQGVLRSRGAHLHVVHGGTDERLSYGRKRLLAALPLTFVAVSSFVRGRLVAHGVPEDRITVIHNFLHGEPPPPRGPFVADGVRRVILLTRLDRIKRVGLLFDALEKVPALAQAKLQFDVYGTGEQDAELRARAAAHPRVRLHGVQADAARHLAEADLLLHTCPEEPFGLAILEAFAAGVPVLAPNAGGAGGPDGIVRDGVCGVLFTANSPVHLGRQLLALSAAPAAQLAALAEGGRRALAERFDPGRQAACYARLLQPGDPVTPRSVTA